jgi:hypothetical protein
MQGDRRPDRFDILLKDSVASQKITGGICTVNLETFVHGAVLMRQAHVVEHCACIKQFWIEYQPAALSGERSPMIDAAGMVEQQRRLGIPDQLRDLTGEPTVGNAKFLRPQMSSRLSLSFVSPAK